MAEINFSQQINTLEPLGTVDDYTYVVASNLQDNSIYNSSAMSLSVIRDDTIEAIRKIEEFNPTGTWNFEKGITLPERTLNLALRNGLSSTLISKKQIENDFMKLLNELSSNIYKTPHLPSAVGEIIFSTYCKTEAKVKKIYGEYTSWKQIPGRFLLATSDSNNKLKKSGIRGGEATHAPTINEIPMHEHKFVSGTELTDFELEKSVNVLEEGVENVLTKDSGYAPKVHSGSSGWAATNTKPTAITVSYYCKSCESFYGDGSSDGASIKESTLKNKPHSNMPPFYAVYIWERIK